MSVNKKMHPRNIFKTPPPFCELGQKYPEFNKHLRIGLDGKLSLNFNDIDALRALSEVLLLHYFGIIIKIPKETLVPTIPLRLNYILWLQDLADFLEVSNNDITIIDVGAGATCIYGLLATKLRKWKVLALESNNESFIVAKHNVEINSMADYIEVKKNENHDDNILIGSLNSTKNYTFSMCNPPFFEENDLSNEKSTKIKSRPPNNAFTGTSNELAYPGGEVAFIEKLIAESKLLKDKIIIYTTMIGHKKNLRILRQSLKTAEVHSFIQTEFCQGNTTRWALAWTFKNINLREFQFNTTDVCKKAIHSKKQNISHVFKNNLCLENFLLQLKTILKEMRMIYETLYFNENLAELKVRAIENTWKNARRKRREQVRKENLLKSVETTLSVVNMYVGTDYDEQIDVIINTLSDNNQNRTELFINNMTKLKNILNKINEIQLNINTNLTDIHEKLTKIENKDELTMEKILLCENLVIEKRKKLQSFLDTIFKKISTIIDNNDLYDIISSFLKLLPNSSANDSKTKKRSHEDEDVDEHYGKKFKEITENNSKNISKMHNQLDKLQNDFIIEFTILLTKMSDQEGLKITFYKTKENNDSNTLCEIYNYIVNKLDT